MIFGVMFDIAGTTICLKKSVHYNEVQHTFTLLERHASILWKFCGPTLKQKKEGQSSVHGTLRISQDEREIATVPLSSIRKNVLDACRERELSPPKEHIIEGEYTRL